MESQKNTIFEHDENEEHDEDLHIDEKWLVSYSDMMTLLFGFFVMLYVLSINSKEKMEQSLQKISEDGFNEATQEKAVQKNVENLNSLKNKNSIEEVLIELKIKEDLLKSQKDDLIEAKNKIEEKDNKLKLQNDELLQIKSNFEDSELKKKQLAETTKQLEEQLKKKEEDIKLLTEKNTEKLDDKKDKKIKELENELLKISQNKASNSINIKNMNKENQILSKKIDDLLAKNSQLEEKIQEKQNLRNNQNFLMVTVQWTTEKHDIDMIIEDPKGNVFNFKKRKIDNVPGEFIIDSRMGPGIETWIADKITKGDYKVKIKLYNQYGNKEDALVKASIYSSTSVKNTDIFKLNNNLQQKEKTIIIHAEDDGTFRLN